MGLRVAQIQHPVGVVPRPDLECDEAGLDAQLFAVVNNVAPEHPSDVIWAESLVVGRKAADCVCRDRCLCELTQGVRSGLPLVAFGHAGSLFGEPPAHQLSNRLVEISIAEHFHFFFFEVWFQVAIKRLRQFVMDLASFRVATWCKLSVGWASQRLQTALRPNACVTAMCRSSRAPNFRTKRLQRDVPVTST